MIQMSDMPEDFVPQTELERAYIQSTGLDPRRLYDRAWQSKNRGDFAMAVGQSAALVSKSVLKNREDWLIAALELLNFGIEKLTEHQKFSLFKCCAHVVRTLFDDGFELTDKYVSVIMHLMLRLFFCAGELRGVQIVCMMRLLHGIYGGPHWLSAFSFLASESGHPTAPIGMLDASMTDAQREFFGNSPLSMDSKKRLTRENYWRNKVKPPAAQPTLGAGSPNEVSVGSRKLPRNEIKTKSAQLDDFHEDLVAIIEKHGFRSPQTVQALVRLAEFADDEKLVPVDQYLSDLAGIIEDDSVDISQFDLRRIYLVSGRVQSEKHLLPVAEKLQRLVFSRREKDLCCYGTGKGT